MKFKPITPGMVIHCPKEEDARTLLEHLGQKGYWWKDGRTLDDKSMLNAIRENFMEGYKCLIETGFRKDDLSKAVVLTNRNTPIPITEFSDLIEPDDSPINSDTDSPDEMSAIDLLEWFHEHGNDNDLLVKLFDGDIGFSAITRHHTSRDVIKRITAYEAAKAPKPVDGERVDACKQIADHYGYECQSIKCIEELSELIKAICKYNQSGTIEDRVHIVEELADVEIMAYQLIYLLGCENQVQEVTEIKLERQLRRMANDE